MKKKLITVCWSVTIEAKLPKGVGVDELEAFDAPKKIQDLASDIVSEACANLNWRDGVIADVQDAE